MMADSKIDIAGIIDMANQNDKISDIHISA